MLTFALCCLKFLQLVRIEFVLGIYRKCLLFSCHGLVEQAIGIERLTKRVEDESFFTFGNRYSFASVSESFRGVAKRHISRGGIGPGGIVQHGVVFGESL